ncbi:MAG: hypothetical protein V9G04_17560 [Nocardioides sp.]
MTDLDHPQPLGAFGFPAGMLLVPSGRDTDAARTALVQGRRPEVWPPSMQGHRAVHEDEPTSGFFTGDDAISAYNAWVLDPDPGRAEVIRAELPGSVAPLVDVVLSMISHHPMAPPLPGPDCVAEVAALVLAARATSGAGDLVDGLLAAADLAEGAAAAVFRGNAGMLLAQSGDPRAYESLTRAIDELADTDLTDVAAELCLQLGSSAQQNAASGHGDPRESLQEAMGHYYAGLQRVTEQSDPVLWASLNLNLATAQLAVPMTEATDQLRLGVATQALRACRRVFEVDRYPAQWSTATLNLANALIYTPSTHQGDNLVEAVELYEEVLASGVRHHDPLGRARLLANQGNALAHLGVFEDARAKLVEARFLFEEHLDHDAALAVRGILDEIRKASVQDVDAELADLTRQVEQMARMPQTEGVFTSGMGVTAMPAGEGPPPRPTVTVVDPSTRPTSDPSESR